MFPFFRLANRKVTICHWVFDLYPEAILVNSAKWMKIAASLIKPILPFVYRQVDIMADIGSCMRERVKRYGHSAHCETLTPWALVEPAEMPPACQEMRKELFGDAQLFQQRIIPIPCHWIQHLGGGGNRFFHTYIPRKRISKQVGNKQQMLCPTQ